jgi:NADPH:quinone reductase-like Zn-dependent oxidoreductase
MTAVVLQSYGGAEALVVEERPVPRPGANEVLIKVAASPINPSDLAFLDGNYVSDRTPPVVAGLEGSGTVVAVGSGLMARYLMGKRVAFIASGDGPWADYSLTHSNLALPLSASTALEEGAMSIVNPLTAVALLSIARDGGHKALVQTAAAGALGQMIVRLAPGEHVTVINIVRRPEQEALLRVHGAQIIVNSEQAEFDERLAQACRKNDAHLALDAVAGELSLRVLKALPSESRLIVYGGLSEEAVRIDPGDLIFQNKRVEGFWLTSWMGRMNLLQSLMLWRRAQRLMATELQTNIRARYPLEDAKTAVEAYQDQMTGGKILLVPGSS